MKCIILAGGFATRLWPLSEKRAKPLLHLKDRPMLSHMVERLPQDIEIMISVNRAYAEGLSEWAKSYAHRPLKILIESSTSDESKLGALGATAHTIQSAAIEEDILVLTGDNYFGFKMTDFIRAFGGQPLLAAYDLRDLQAAKKFGVVVEKNGHAMEFQEKPEHPKSTLVSTGCFVFPQKNLKDIIAYAKLKPDNIGGIFEYLLKQGETIDVFRFTEPWYDIGSFDAYLQANADLIGNEVIQKEGVILEGKNEFGGGVYLGKNVTVKNSILRDCLVLENSVIDDCVLRQCVIDEGSELRGIDLSHQMIRAGSRIVRNK